VSTSLSSSFKCKLCELCSLLRACSHGSPVSRSVDSGCSRSGDGVKSTWSASVWALGLDVTHSEVWKNSSTLYPVYTRKQTWSEQETNVFNIHVHDVCFMYASSCKRGITHTYSVSQKKPGHLLHFQITLNNPSSTSAHFGTKKSLYSYSQHLIPGVTLYKKILRSQYQLRFSCGTHTRSSCEVLLPTKQQCQAQMINLLNIIMLRNVDYWHHDC